MKNRLKYHLRSLKAQKKFLPVINLIILIHHNIKGIRQFVSKTTVEKTLANADIGHDPESWLNFIWNANDGFFRPIQDYGEILSLTTLVAQRKPKSVLEIGTAGGGSLFLLCQAATSNASIFSVDLPGSINGGGYPKWKEKLYLKFKKEQQQLNLLRKDSHLESTRNEIEDLIAGAKFDVIMIDADHSYEGVKRDFELYKELISDDGIIILHDVIKNKFDPSIQVDELWNEIKQDYKTVEIVNKVGRGNMGLGIVYFNQAEQST